MINSRGSLHPKPFQLIDKAAPCNAQEFGCSGTIAIGLIKSAPDGVYLGLSKRLDIRLTVAGVSSCRGNGGCGGTNSRRQVFGENDVGLGEKSRVLHGICEFTHIARPLISCQDSGRRMGKPFGFGLSMNQKVSRQGQDIFLSLTKGGDFDGNDVQAIIEIPPKTACFNFLQQAPLVAARRR